MSTTKLKFTDSPYFYVDENGWNIREDAPEEVKKEFEEYMEYSKKLQEEGIFI